jgi:cellulose synthase/poly-beta-1,6-N-acetylglucosamine synthase-like glycosyltransferase
MQLILTLYQLPTEYFVFPTLLVNNFASIMKWDCAIAKNRQIPLTMGPPKISVLIPCFRQARFLPEALDSVLRQDFHDL